MAHTFDVRFSKPSGAAAVLRVDATGISFNRLGLSSLFRRSTRIEAREIRQVSREGELLTLEFSTGSRRAVLPFQARTAEVAAEIVKVLPTTRTIEFESSARVSRAAKQPVDWRIVALAFGLVGISVGL